MEFEPNSDGERKIRRLQEIRSYCFVKVIPRLDNRLPCLFHSNMVKVNELQCPKQE